VRIEHVVVPSSQNPLGVKGVGESGLVPVPAAIASAVDDAFAQADMRITDIPIAPTDILARTKEL
jgi:aerobic carbon-monoxide dehydrogenase large subunit